MVYLNWLDYISSFLKLYILIDLVQPVPGKTRPERVYLNTNRNPEYISEVSFEKNHIRSLFWKEPPEYKSESWINVTSFLALFWKETWTLTIHDFDLHLDDHSECLLFGNWLYSFIDLVYLHCVIVIGLSSLVYLSWHIFIDFGVFVIDLTSWLCRKTYEGISSLNSGVLQMFCLHLFHTVAIWHTQKVIDCNRLQQTATDCNTQLMRCSVYIYSTHPPAP